MYCQKIDKFCITIKIKTNNINNMINNDMEHIYNIILSIFLGVVLVMIFNSLFNSPCTVTLFGDNPKKY